MRFHNKDIGTVQHAILDKNCRKLLYSVDKEEEKSRSPSLVNTGYH